MKKLLALTLSLLLVVSLFGGPINASSDDWKSPEGIDAETWAGMSATERLRAPYEEPITVNIVLSYIPSQNLDAPEDLSPETSTNVWKLKEDLNIDLVYRWIANGDQYEAKFAAELAAGIIPDIMYLPLSQFQDLYEQGGLGVLDEAWEEYADEQLISHFNFDGQLLDIGRRDGDLYGIPRASHPAQATSQTYYDLTKLAPLGYDSYEKLPTTIAEFEALCDLIMANDIDGDGKTGEPVLPGNKFYYGSGLCDFTPVFHAYEAWFDGWYEDEDGTLQSYLINSNVKPALAKLNEWYNNGYFEKDFAAQNVWGSDPKCVDDVVAGEYGIVFGSWWIANWPLNGNMEVDPGSNWVVGPTLTLDKTEPRTMISRYNASDLMCISRDFKHAEALFKMVKWNDDFGAYTNTYDFKQNATEEDKAMVASYVWDWTPIRSADPESHFRNFLYIKDKRDNNVTELPEEEFNDWWSVWEAYQRGIAEDATASEKGWYLSRLHPEGGVARMFDVYTNGNLIYNEAYVATSTMALRGGELESLRDTTVLSIIMGEHPLDSWDDFTAQWKDLGGDQIRDELNEWYLTVQ